MFDLITVFERVAVCSELSIGNGALLPVAEQNHCYLQPVTFQYATGSPPTWSFSGAVLLTIGFFMVKYTVNVKQKSRDEDGSRMGCFFGAV